MKDSESKPRDAHGLSLARKAKRLVAGRRALLAIPCLAALASEAISLGVSHKHVWQISSTNVSSDVTKPESVNQKSRAATAAFSVAPQSSATP